MIRTDEDVGALRREVAVLAAGLPGLRHGDVELVATELATNIIRHTTTGGYVLYRQTAGGIELLAIDHGPGGRPAGTPPWAVPSRLGQTRLRPFRGDGLGVGLAAVQRLASAFDCYSEPGGTVILARLGLPTPVTAGRWRWGGVNVPLGGVGESGDAWAVTAKQHLAALVVDGLGHGPAAAMAARAAVTLFERQEVTDLDGFVRRAHEAMRGTRGGVMGVCLIDPERDELTYAGVGNISGRVLLRGDSHTLLGRDGTLGTELPPPRIRLARYPWGPGATLLLASDGIRSRWDAASYPKLLHHDPAVIAATLQRAHGRGNDDTTVLVVHDTRDRELRSAPGEGGGP
ncbi:SpoIIE family protein phosphatase [Actinomadura sp. HBU206391]|uniref:SpoIIE family protein phosphatase n=1 Tax=Actinomadura sp. HBU206391 TaxID=2731692 RepID=UPI001C9D52EC|nr:SpoIIE family protein phosphatase [Actinomadura sp. HBU206391]